MTAFLTVMCFCGGWVSELNLWMGYVAFGTISIGIFVLASAKLDGLATVLIGIIYDRKGYQISRDRKYFKYIYIGTMGIFQKNKYYCYIKASKNILAYAQFTLEARNEISFNLIVKKCRDRQKNDKSLNVILGVLDYMYFKKYYVVRECILQGIELTKKDANIASAFVTDIENRFINGKYDCIKVSHYLAKRRVELRKNG